MNELTQIQIPYYIIFTLALTVSALVLFLAWRFRSGNGVLAFMVSVSLELSWLIGYMFELSSNTLEMKLFWDNFQYIGALFAPIGLLVFALQFTKVKFNLQNLLTLLLPVAGILQTIIFLDLWPDLIHVTPAIEAGIPWNEFTYKFGPITTVANIYAQLLALAYVVILLFGFFKRNIDHRQLAVVTLGTAIPTVGVILGLMFGWKFANQRDISPLMFVISNMVIAWGIFWMRLFNIVPIAREALFERMSNILVILDKNDRILDLNSAGQKIFNNRSKDDLIGTHISLLQPELYQKLGKTLDIRTELTDEQERTFSFDITPLFDNRGMFIGRLVNAHDVSEQKRIAKNLQEISDQNDVRARRLDAISDISQAISQIRDLEALLPVITRQISQKFDFYHVGIFLFSSDGRYAELIAANSEGGKRMLERGHRLEIGQVGVVGKVAQDGTPRVALDVGQDAVYFDNPDLPKTHSEMALPLRVGTTTIGVLDVQSKRKNVFSEEDAEVFISLANQVAIAIDNARQVAATQSALEEARLLTQEYVREAWTKLAAQEANLGYRFANDAVFPYNKQDDKGLAGDMQILEFPVQLRDEVIGIIKVRMTNTEAKKMTENDKALLQAIGDRAGLALESARFLEETQRKAQREAVISNISAKIGSSIRIDNIIQTTVRELGEALDASEIAFKLVETSDMKDEDK